jgi:hypothetical protein
MGRREKESRPEMIDLVEMLAAELHRQYRATEKAMHRDGTKSSHPNCFMHDHGFASCSKQKYFRKRARLIMRRASCTDPQTLGEAEETLQAAVLQRRLIVEGKGGRI